jgi:hypothetical protein
MPAINRRRGSAAILVRGLRGGLPFCSGGNLRHVFLDRFQLGEQAMRVSRIDAFERGRRQFGAQPAQFAEQRTRSLAQIEPVDAAVGIVAAAFNPAVIA